MCRDEDVVLVIRSDAVGADAYGLLADWGPAVAACAAGQSMNFGWRSSASHKLTLQPRRTRKLVDVTFAGVACAFHWDDAGVLRARAQGHFMLYRDDCGDVRAKPRKRGRPIDVVLDGIPAVECRPMPGDGWGLVEAEWYYGYLRERLPAEIRQPTDDFVGVLYPPSVGRSGAVDDFSADVGIPLERPVVYGLRPATVREALLRSSLVPWDGLREAAAANEVWPGNPRAMDIETFGIVLTYQIRWLQEAADSGRGVVAMLSV